MLPYVRILIVTIGIILQGCSGPQSWITLWVVSRADAELSDDETEGETVEGEKEGEAGEGETEDGEAGPEEITSAMPTPFIIGVPAEGVDWITSPWGAGESWNEYVSRLRPCFASAVLAW